MTTYTTQISKSEISGKTISVVCLTPLLSADEKKNIKLRIEQQLYAIFCKFSPTKL